MQRRGVNFSIKTGTMFFGVASIFKIYFDYSIFKISSDYFSNFLRFFEFFNFFLFFSSTTVRFFSSDFPLVQRKLNKPVLSFIAITNTSCNERK